MGCFALTALTLDNLSLYRAGQAVVESLSASFPLGSLTALTGPNGGGKSTLLEALAGIFPTKHMRGLLKWGACHQGELAYLPQKSQINRLFPLVVQDVVAGGFFRDLGPWKPLQSKHRYCIAEALERVGLAGCTGRSLSQLSGGQFQRVLFARLIVQNAPFLLLDEPFTGVDEATQNDLMALIQSWNHMGKTVIVVLHDAEKVRTHFPQVLWLQRNTFFLRET